MKLRSKSAVGDAASELVSRVYDDLLGGNCVVFVGAGSTTEQEPSDGPTFYEEIRKKASYPAKVPDPSFPVLMQYFCDRIDGGRHNRLITEAISRIEHFCAQGEDKYLATRFCESIAQIPYVNGFVTTNWDPFLERALDVLIPIVDDRDLAFWDDRKRQVLKIHGCVTRPYSIVATQSDYEQCMKRNPLIFNKLRDLMATKTFIFVGYSMRDSDFREIWDGIIGKLGHFTKLAYAADPKATADQIAFWKERGIELINTRDTWFVKSLRERLEKDGLIPSEKLLRFMQRSYREIRSAHLSNNQDSSAKFASAMYQDGLLHALDDVIASSGLGTKTKEDFEKELGDQTRVLNNMRRRRDPVEIAYFSGRVEVLERFCNRTTTPIPKYFHPYRVHPTDKLVGDGRRLGSRPSKRLRRAKTVRSQIQ